MARTLALVVRVSDVAGRDKRGDRFISPETQIGLATGYAQARGFDVEVIDPQDLNVSHTTPLDKRPAMGQALRRIEAGELAGLVVSSADRLGPLTIVRELKQRISASEAVLLVPDNPGLENVSARGYAKLPGEQMALMHEAHREEIGIRWDSAKESAVNRGVVVGPASFGYRKTKDGTLVPHPKQAPIVSQLFGKRAAGVGVATLCDWLESVGVRTRDGNRGWSKQAVLRILRNRLYLGELRHGEHVNESAHEPLVDEVTFLAAQTAKVTPKAPRRQEESPFLLTGMLICTGCGYVMNGNRRARNGKHTDQGQRIYRCVGRSATKRCSCPAQVSAEKIEAEVERVLWLHVDDRIEHERKRKPAESPIPALEQALAEAARRYEQSRAPEVMDALGDDWAPTTKRYREAFEKAAADLGKARLEDSAEEPLDVVTMRQLWDSGVQARKRLIRLVYDAIAFDMPTKQPVIYPKGTGHLLTRGQPIKLDDHELVSASAMPREWYSAERRYVLEGPPPPNPKKRLVAE